MFKGIPTWFVVIWIASFGAGIGFIGFGCWLAYKLVMWVIAH